MFPRIVQYRGEPLGLLQQLGFNAVWLAQPPATEMLDEANRLGLWLVCPPPRPVVTAEGPGARPPVAGQASLSDGEHTALLPAALGEIGPQFDCVLAWDLGSDLTAADLEPTQRWAQQVRAADRRANRPLVCKPRAELRGFSRAANLLLIDRRPVGTSFELSDYGAWVRRQRRQHLLARLPARRQCRRQPGPARRAAARGGHRGHPGDDLAGPRGARRGPKVRMPGSSHPVYAIAELPQAQQMPIEHLRLVLGEWIVEMSSSANLVVVRTPPGSAHVVASALDRSRLEGMVGTVAGDDTELRRGRRGDRGG